MRSTLLFALLLLASCVSGRNAPVAPTPSSPSPGAGNGPAAPAEETTDPDPGLPATRTDHPSLVFTANGHYFGLLEKRSKASHTAVFYNVGREPLVIREVKTHCGCAAALLSSARIPPGGRGTLQVTLDSGTLPGKRTKNVEVFTNDPVTPVAVYPISCDVIADAAVDPIMLVVRATRSGGPIESGFDVYSMRPGFDLKVLDVRSSNPGVTTEVSPIPSNEDRTGYRVRVVFGPELDSGDFHERLTVTTNSRRDPRLTVDVIGSVRESVLIVPERLFFPRLAPGDSASRRLYVYRTDGKPLTVTELTDNAGIFEFEKKAVSDSKWEIRIVLSGEAPAQTVRGSLIVHTDAPDEPRVAVPYEIPGAK